MKSQWKYFHFNETTLDATSSASLKSMYEWMYLRFSKYLGKFYAKYTKDNW